MTNRQAATKIIRRLRAAGFEALLAGGCVRDMLLGRRAKDYDVATDAKPQQVTKLFRRTIKVGAQFGVVMVLIGREQVEVATFRSEAGYDDGRHPGRVKFVNAKEDAMRRDFTINGMFYDPFGRKVIDYVGGRADLKKGLIRTIGKPQERFAEDYLRMLRAVRFSTQLGFRIEAATLSAIRVGGGNITKISGERICMELEGILVSPKRGFGVTVLIETGLAEKIFPTFAAKKIRDCVAVLTQLPVKVNFILALASVFAHMPTDFALEKCRLLKLSRSQSRHLKFLLSNRGVLLDADMPLAALRKIAAQPHFRDLYEFQKATQKATAGGKESIAPLVKIRQRIKRLGDIELTPRPLLNGHELIELGAVAGPGLGHLAEEMYVAQLEGQIGTAEQARAWVRNWLELHRPVQD